MMGQDDSLDHGEMAVSQSDVDGSAELVLFQVRECYVYIIPPRKSSASYRADEWDINKWNWEGSLRVISKGVQCFIKLEDKSSGELYAQALVRPDYPLPVEAVLDSSRFFVLRIEDTSSSGNARHAFIGLGFRERPEAYDFQAAIFDHVKYLNKKKEAEEMVHDYQSKPSVDYSLKEGETLRLQLKTKNNATGDHPKLDSTSAVSSQHESVTETSKKFALMRVVSGGHGVPMLVPPPPPPLSPMSGSSPRNYQWPDSPVSSGAVGHSMSSDFKLVPSDNVDKSLNVESEVVEEDFGDFQAA